MVVAATEKHLGHLCPVTGGFQGKTQRGFPQAPALLCTATCPEPFPSLAPPHPSHIPGQGAKPSPLPWSRRRQLLTSSWLSLPALMQTTATQGLVPRRGIRSRKRSMSCHKASGASKGMSHGGAFSGRLGCQDGGGQDVPLHPKTLPCAPEWSKIWARSQLSQLLPQVCAQERHSIVTRLLQAELWLEHFPNFPFAHNLKGRGRMGALRAEPAALGRCCARSRGRSAKGNTNILPKESTFHRQHKFPFLHRAGLFRAAFPTALRAGLWPGPPFLPHVRPTETRQRHHIGTWGGFRCETPPS